MNTLFKTPYAKQKHEISQENDLTGSIRMIHPDKLFPNPSQPRFIFEDEPLLRLADSIRRNGILQPLTVRKNFRDDPNDVSYQIIAGERRWRAARIASLEAIPCIILDTDTQKSAELALIENIQREDLNPFEQASAIASLIDVYELTQEQAAKQLSSSQSYIANKLRLLKLTPKERTEIIKYKLTERHARALLRIPDTETRLQAIQHIAAKELNVSATERYIDKLISQEAEQPIFAQAIKGHLKDLRFFYNSIDRAVDILKNCGVDVITEKTSSNGESLVIIRITA